VNASRKVRWPAQAAYGALLAVGLLAGIGLALASTAYVRSRQAVSALEATVTDFRVVDDENPRAELTLQLSSSSSVPVAAEKCVVALTLNESYVASTQSAYAGAAAAPQQATYAQQTTIGQELVAGRPWSAHVTLYIDAPEMAMVRAQRQAGSVVWRAQIAIYITLPFSQQHDVVGRSVDLQE